MTDADKFVTLFGSWLVLVLVVLLTGLREPWFWKLGGKIMSVIDEAIARFTTFTQGVLAQLKGAKDSNDLQTGKLTELQTALDAARGDARPCCPRAGVCVVGKNAARCPP